MAKTPGGRLMLLEYVIEEMQDCMEVLGGKPTFIETVIRALDETGVITDERHKKRCQRVDEKVMRREAPFNKVFHVRDPDDPHNWEKITVWPYDLFTEQRAAAIKPK